MTDAMLIRKLLRATWFLAGAALVGFLTLQNLPPRGVHVVRVAPGEASPFVGILRPEGRVTIVKEESPRYVITDDPVYFQLAMPRFFRRATVTLEFRNEKHLDISLGPSQSLKTWGFALQPLDTKMPQNEVDEDGTGWTLGRATFDASQMALANGEVQMAISIPKAGKVPGVVEIRGIEVRYEREALTYGEMFSAMRRKFHL